MCVCACALVCVVCVWRGPYSAASCLRRSKLSAVCGEAVRRESGLACVVRFECVLRAERVREGKGFLGRGGFVINP